MVLIQVKYMTMKMMMNSHHIEEDIKITTNQKDLMIMNHNLIIDLIKCQHRIFSIKDQQI